MNLPDLINGSFEALGGLFAWTNVYKLWLDKKLMGVYYLPTVLFTAWGFWNLFYYPHLDQWFSFTGGLAIVSANSAWLYLALKYRKN